MRHLSPNFKTILFILFIAILCPSVYGQPSAKNVKIKKDTTYKAYWKELQKLCGKSYKGVVFAGTQNDTTFTGKDLVMHVKKCSQNVIKIPFYVGNDYSRTWVLTKTANGILLKHDHRHPDGSPDKVTMYGGHTTNYGNSTRQTFPADQETVDILPAAIGNVWWIEIISRKLFTYNLRRVNTDRYFSVHFDLSKETETPPAPWGWKE
jgi:hypothetical protein